MDYRVQFDFEIEFTNGGGIAGRGFRLDIIGDEVTDQELADYIVQDMRLLMVGKVEILNKMIIQEKHKRQKPINKYSEVDNFIDLSHKIEDGLITYKGLPAPIICDYLSRDDSREFYEKGTEFQIDKIELVGNTGTYIDSPFHRYANGKDLSEMHINQFVDLDGIVIRIDCEKTQAIHADYFRNREIRGRAVLVHTGWDKYWKTDRYFEDHPYLTQDAAEYLVECGVALVGIDSMNIDDTKGKARPVHTTLLGNEIPIVEHLCNLEKLPDEGFTFTAAPPKIKDVGTFPVRAMAKLNL